MWDSRHQLWFADSATATTLPNTPLSQVPVSEKAWYLVKARRLVTPAKNIAAPPSYLHSRVARGQPLSRVVLPRTPLPRKVKGEEGRRLRTTLAFVCGMSGGPEGEGMPRDVFRVVMDLLMPSWDPLRRGVVGEGGMQLE